MLIGQLASGSAILLMAIIAFYKHDFKFEASTLVKVSFLVLVSFILALFSWMIPILGFPALKVGFSQIPLMLVGFLYGPSWAFIAGFSSDAIELLSGTIMTPFLGFTLNKILIAMIPALIRKYKHQAKLAEIVFLVSLICLSAIMYVFTRNDISVNDVLVHIDMYTKIIVSLGILILSTLLVFSIHFITKKEANSYMYLWVLVVIVVELIVNMTLTPVWLYAMYSIPISISISLRLLKMIIMIPLTTFFGLMTLKVLTKLKV